MSKKKKIENIMAAPNEVYVAEQKNYVAKINDSIEYSLEVDPKGIYFLRDNEKDFIKHFVYVQNMDVAAELAGMSRDEAISCYKSYAFQREIERLTRAIYHRSCANKIMSRDEIKGLLTSWITDDMPLSYRLSNKDKLQAVKILTEMEKEDREIVNSPDVIDLTKYDEQIAKIDTKSLKGMIEKSNRDEEEQHAKSEEIIEKICNIVPMSETEKEALKLLSVDKLEELLERAEEEREG